MWYQLEYPIPYIAQFVFLLQIEPIENIVFGISCLKDLEQILSSRFIDVNFPNFNLDPQLCDPRKW